MSGCSRRLFKNRGLLKATSKFDAFWLIISFQVVLLLGFKDDFLDPIYLSNRTNYYFQISRLSFISLNDEKLGLPLARCERSYEHLILQQQSENIFIPLIHASPLGIINDGLQLFLKLHSTLPSYVLWRFDFLQVSTHVYLLSAYTWGAIFNPGVVIIFIFAIIYFF